MNKNPEWYFNEKQIGVDYMNSKIAQEYNNQHESFRNFKEESEKIVSELGINPDDTVVDFGCGTGGISLNLAKYCKKVICVDISSSMLEILKNNAKNENINNIETHCAGFLSYKHQGAKVNKIISIFSMHHLPDFWKSVALLKMNKILKKGGKLYLFDVAFTFEVENYEHNIGDFIDTMQKNAGNDMAKETIIHIKEEYSTYNWIMTSLIEKSGFFIDSKKIESENIVCYICTVL
ncbi:class I SAM-dependent methyltransferase [Methanobacterium alcaliphilum]|uniref:class I SAM-dependent methyltransferase n=1 Tax=Methanobacterium alcaliphilum TaxID=392018 RepID=UPI00200A61DA|nr:class I SAM-dependent methyltransferase [Methanobacterium alcaliphilum]MCK9151875.1 class I SAM-dependent methyltransferase [Methanobacterium alcaliphilum]